MIEPKKTGYVLTGTANIYYQIFGSEKTTLILLHGNGEDWRVFHKQIGPLSNYFKIVTIDSRGHGLSSRGIESLSIDLMAKDVYHVMRALKIQSAYVTGFSDGGNIALELALKHPNLVKKLILAGANLNPSGLKTWVQSRDAALYVIFKICSLFSKKAKRKVELLDLMVNQPNFTIGEISTLNIPTLVLAGEHDMIKREHTELIARSIPNAEMKVIQGADHFIFENAADKTNIIIISFLLQKL